MSAAYLRARLAEIHAQQQPAPQPVFATECPTALCRCGTCAECGMPLHVAKHSPRLRALSGGSWGHEFKPQQQVGNAGSRRR